MTEAIKKLLAEQQEAQAVVGRATNSFSIVNEALQKATEVEMKATVPAGMKIVPFEIAYMGEDREESGFVCVPLEYAPKVVWGYKRCYDKEEHRQNDAGRFGVKIPATMLVWDDEEDSSTWLQWRPWEEVFADFLLGHKD